MVSVHLTVTGGESVPLAVDAPRRVPLEAGVPYIGGMLPEYTGPTTVTPSGSEQTLATAGRSMGRDIVVGPIPSNYGLVSWDGSVLTVS